MPARDTYAIGVAVVAVLAAMGIGATLESAGYLTDWTNLLGFLVIAGLGVAVPQLYLARTDDSVPAQWRYRVVLLVGIVVGGSYSSEAATLEIIAIWVCIGLAILGITITEYRAGLRASIGLGDRAAE